MDDEIFTWQDSSGAARKGDPLDLLRRLNVGSPQGDVNVLLDAAESKQEATAISGAKALAALVCRTFTLGEPFSEETGRGVLEGRWRAVLNSYLGHLEKNAPPAETTPTSAPSSAPAPFSSPPSSDSGSASILATA